MSSREQATNWRPGRDYRIVCDCQRHARSRSLWRRAWRVTSRGVAVLVGIPIAFAIADLPTMKAMNLNFTALRREVAPARTLPIFTTPAMKNQFLTPGTAATVMSLDVVKEQYFRTSVPYGDIIYREARRNDLRPELVAAMVHTESDFRPRLVSNRSAQGLMQIVPETARLLGIANPFDPEQNIAAGTKYFRYLLNRFENENVALAAYNAGEGNVERFGGIPPFPETRDYIARVNVREHRYRERVQNTYMASLRLRALH